MSGAYPLPYSHGQKKIGVKTCLKAQSSAGLHHPDEVLSSPFSLKQEQVGRFVAKL